MGQFRVPFSLESLLSSTILETTERSRIVNAAKRDIGAQAEWRIPDRVALQVALVNGEGPNRGTNPDNRMAYFARAVGTPIKLLDVGAAFEGYNDSTGVDGQAMYRLRSDDFKPIADYEVFREQAVQLKNNRGAVQMQVRW